jgi:hypothetical protein
MANFNTALKAETGVAPEATQEDATEGEAAPSLTPKPAAAPAPTKGAEESIVPEQFTSTPKPAEKKEDPNEILPADERGQLVAKLGPKANESFSKLEAAAKAKVAALQAELAEARKKAEVAPAALPKEHEEALRAVQTRAAELEQKLERAAYTDSPRYQKFGADIAAELDSAKAYTEGTSLSPAAVEVAASQTGQARLKTLRDAGADTETIAAIAPFLARADAIKRERDASLEHWKADLTKEQQNQQARQAQETARLQQEEKQTWEKVASEMRNKHPAFTKVEGKDKWNKLVDENERLSEDFAMGRMPLEDLFRLGREGVAARTVKLMNDTLIQHNNALLEEVGRLRAAQPGTGHSVAPAANTAATGSEMDQLKASFNAAKAQLGAT